MNIILIGFRGSGKSTVGRVLADRLGWSFVDTDALVEQRTDMTIRDIFTDCTEEVFRSLESQIVAEVSQLDNCVIGTGGGVVLSPQNVEMLKQTGYLVYLVASPEILLHRIMGDAKRYSTRLHIDPDEGLGQILTAIESRDPLYAAAADLALDTDNRSVLDIVDEIITSISLPSD